MNSQDISYPPIYVINLKRTPERKLHIQRELDALNLSYKFVEAIDKYDLHCPDYRRTLAQQLNIKEHEIASMCEKMKERNIACALSHIKVYNLMIENNISVACILEDDGHLLSTFPNMLAASKEVSWDVLMFSHQSEIIRQILHEFYNNLRKGRILRALCHLRRHKISHPQLNLYIMIPTLLYIAKDTILDKLKSKKSPGTVNSPYYQYCGCRLGAVPSRDKSFQLKSTSDHYIVQPKKIAGNSPTSAMSYMLTRSAAIKWKHAIISGSLIVDLAIGYLWSEENLNLYMVMPPCVTAARHYLFYSSRLK